ncbi:uncharacterized protein PV09_06497 [Verruconis gallopava]|uniref:3-keto-steroid reductase n=1 Tax=Verruconis gallopava TaxID=253628 RepID=A0A0D1YMJ5_9PEZI|nr:uncharacterized protein PV09_06497 [Verruconis gallopava]KIW01987.1 hypothetical protein PV09_06497 [Verruconis gallopava]
MSANTFVVLVTGANSGIGFAICCRLIDEFLATREATEKLCLIPTTRSQEKAEATVLRLQKHLEKFCQDVEKAEPGVAAQLKSRVVFEPELLDLCNILSVQRAAKRLRRKYARIDSAILNAGIGGWVGIDWVKAITQFFTQGMKFVTRPEYKIGSVGERSPVQFPRASDNEEANEANGKGDARKEPEMGAVFTANVFGHYLLVHYLMPLLSRPAGQEAGRVIWVGTLEAYKHTFSLDDFQGMRTSMAYESSKRLTDLLVMTANAPTSKPYTTSFFALDSTEPPSFASSTSLEEDLTPRKASLRASTRARSSTPNGRLGSRSSSPRRGSASSSSMTPPEMYSTHPGMVVTDIIALPHWLLIWAWTAVFYIARWCGSPWHNTQPYSGATAMTHLALAPKEQLDKFARGNASDIKWGSATNWRGNERVKITEVEGLYNDKGVPYSDEEREKFFQLGREVWKRMEDLRTEWENRLKDAGFDEGLA